ncbi:MAG: hypothetical protein QY326_05660 [Bdellovibrionota bacterium]|nr:MAG: hypothetical protein QY326_05660 [Bdellovibrionota bacterium]
MSQWTSVHEVEGTGVFTPRDAAVLLLLVLVALVLRLDPLIASAFVIDSDEAIVGLMAKHVLEGGPIPTFYYGQHYMGSLEPLLVAAVGWMLGLDNIALKLVPLLFSLALVPLVFLIANECDGKRAGLVAALLTAAAPQSLLVWSTKARGGFIEIVVIGALALLIALRALRAREVSVHCIAAAFLLGLGWWVNNQIVYFFAPVGLAFLLRIYPDGLAALCSQFLRALCAFLVGSAPYWMYNLQNDFASLGILNSAPPGQVMEHLTGALTVSLPMLLGAKNFWDEADLFPFSTILVLSLYALVFAVAVLRSLGKLGTMRSHTQGVASLLVLLLPLGALAIFSLSRFGYLVQAPRYLLPIYVGLYVLFGIGVAPLFRRMPRLATSLMTLLVVLNLFSSYPGKRAIPGEPFVFAGQRVARDHSELLDWLQERGIAWVRTNYWIGYRLAFESQERVRFRVFQAPFEERIPEYRLASASIPLEQMPLILVPAQAVLIEPGLEALGIAFSRIELSGYVVLYDLARSTVPMRSLPREAVSIETNFNSEAASRAIDGDRATRWGSAHPQAPGMIVRLLTNIDNALARINYDLAEWPHDFPRGLEIRALDAQGATHTLLTPQAYDGMVYYFEGQSYFEFFFPAVNARAIELVQTGSHTLFDWSIAELELWEAAP